MPFLKNSLRNLRLLAFIEGVSFLLILFITMPLKYFLQMPLPNKIVGMAHGVLFIAYILFVLIVKFEKNWGLKKTFLALLASIVPFGTFWADAKLFRDEAIEN
jgi:integral membrane protein